MTSKDYLKQIAESKGVCPLTNEVKDNALLFPIGFEYIFQDLERLEKLEKAFDKACERLDWGCPEEQNLIDDFIDYFDCENCKNTEKECWKKYFLKEALENES